MTHPDETIPEPSLARQVADLAHDLNNQLTIINLNLELASVQLAPDHPTQALITPALKAATTAADLIATVGALKEVKEARAGRRPAPRQGPSPWTS